ncbi:Hypothetical predicted protein, partial [Mytilus galloprovincialis]
RSLLISLRSQMNLNLNAPKGIGLPPASPSDKESNVDSDTTLFLIAGYARYSCPYVWVRSNHQRLIRLTNDSTQEKDSPLRLKSTNKWNSHDIHIWDIIAELVKLCTYPSPMNPFEVDFDYFTTLSLQDRVIATGAMVHCLQNIVLHTQDEKVYASKVFEELQIITKLHFQALQQLVKDGGLPVLQQHIARSNPRQRSTNSGSSRYPSAGPGYQTPSYTSQTYQTQPQRRENNIRRNRVFRDRDNPLDYLDDADIVRKYRLSRPMILELCGMFQNQLARPTKRSHAFPVSLQIMVALRLYATGSFQLVNADVHRISRASVSTITRDVTQCFKKCMQSIHFDAHRSSISTSVKARRRHGWLLGDSGYPLRPWLLTPVINPTTRQDQRYNTCHMRRCAVERSFGVLKSRFLCIDTTAGTLLYSPVRCCDIIVAVVGLEFRCLQETITQEIKETLVGSNMLVIKMTVQLFVLD